MRNVLDMETENIPKAARQFAEDARAAGFAVKVTADAGSVNVFVKRDAISASASWQEKSVYDSPMAAEQVGFRTEAGRGAMRFADGTVETRGGYVFCRSLRQVRGHVGLEMI